MLNRHLRPIACVLWYDNTFAVQFIPIDNQSKAQTHINIHCHAPCVPFATTTYRSCVSLSYDFANREPSSATNLALTRWIWIKWLSDSLSLSLCLWAEERTTMYDAFSSDGFVTFHIYKFSRTSGKKFSPSWSLVWAVSANQFFSPLWMRVNVNVQFNRWIQIEIQSLCRILTFCCGIDGINNNIWLSIWLNLTQNESFRCDKTVCGNSIVLKCWW